MSDGYDQHTQQQFEAQQQRNDDLTAEFEHDAAVACLDFGNDVTVMIDKWGLSRVQKGISAMGYELKAK